MRPFGLVRPIQFDKLGLIPPDKLGLIPPDKLGDRLGLIGPDKLSGLIQHQDKLRGLIHPLNIERVPLPEDLSATSRKEDDKSPARTPAPINNGRKNSSSPPPVSPPKFSPDPEIQDKERSQSPPRKINGSPFPVLPRLPQTPVDMPVCTSAAAISAAAAAAAAAAASLERGGPGSPSPNPLPNPLLFPGFPGLLPPGGLPGLPGASLLSGGPPAVSSANSVLSQLALGNPAGNPFNPLGLPLPGSPGGPGGRPLSK